MQDHSKLPASASKTESLSTTSVAIVGASGSRHGLILCPPSSGTATLMTDSAVTINQGFQISAGDPPLVLCRCQYGDMVTRPWFAISNDGQGPIGRSASEYWSKQDRTIAGDATATQDGVDGFRHVCTSLAANYAAEDTGRILTLYNGSSNLWRTYTRGLDPVIWNDPIGLACDDGEDCTLTLVSGGGGTEGLVAFSGFTIPIPTITYYELGETNASGTNAGGNRPPQY
mgnify:CR=1 FL=1